MVLLEGCSQKFHFPLRRHKKIKYFVIQNLPPIFLKNREISIFIQNRFIVDYNSDEHLDIKSKIRYLILRIIIHLKKKSVSRVFVQGDSMKNLAKKVFPSKCNIEIIRFFSKLKLNESSSQIKYDFLYIASGEKHKNHLNLFKALKLLEQKKQRCKICFTLSKSDRLKFSEYFNFFETSQFITVNNKTNLSRDEISNLYLASKALVFPSFCGISWIASTRSKITRHKYTRIRKRFCKRCLQS